MNRRPGSALVAAGDVALALSASPVTSGTTLLSAVADRCQVPTREWIADPHPSGAMLRLLGRAWQLALRGSLPGEATAVFAHGPSVRAETADWFLVGRVGGPALLLADHGIDLDLIDVTRCALMPELIKALRESAHRSSASAP